MSGQPKWATSDRRNHLVNLFICSKGFCVFGHPDCSIPEHYYEIYIEELIADWKAEDRAKDSADWKAEQRVIHSLAERKYPLRGAFSAVSRDIFFAGQPSFYIVGMGISGVTFRPFALVRLSSTFTSLFVDIGTSLKGLSKNKRRKFVRYHQPLPRDNQLEVANLCKMAVKHYLERK